MKRFYIFAIVILLAFNCNAEINKAISISAIQPTYSYLSEQARTNLESKMQRILSTNGSSCTANDRFIMTSRIDVTDNKINSQGLVLEKMEITFIVGDVITEHVFGTMMMKLVGTGESESQAFVNAFQTINPKNPNFLTFLTSVSDAITDFYQNHCSEILTNADQLVATGKADEALTSLVTTPNICPDCYKACQTKSIDVYQKIVQEKAEELNHQGLILIKKARMLWSAKQDYETAEKALEVLAEVDPNAACSVDADQLAAEISAKLRKDEAAQAAAAKAAWEFKIRQYEDKHALEVQKQADRAAIFGTLANRFGRIDIGIKKEKAFKFGSSSPTN